MRDQEFPSAYPKQNTPPVYVRNTDRRGFAFCQKFLTPNF